MSRNIAALVRVAQTQPEWNLLNRKQRRATIYGARTRCKRVNKHRRINHD